MAIWVKMQISMGNAVLPSNRLVPLPNVINLGPSILIQLVELDIDDKISGYESCMITDSGAQTRN